MAFGYAVRIQLYIFSLVVFDFIPTIASPYVSHNQTVTPRIEDQSMEGMRSRGIDKHILNTRCHNHQQP
jgi:hypothetical protein